MKRRILSMITALALCLSLCPTWAFAVESEIVPDDEVLADEWDLQAALDEVNEPATVDEPTEGDVARVEMPDGTTTYVSALAGAFVAENSGAKITLLADVDIGNEKLVVPGDTSFTLDCGNFTLSGGDDYTIVVYPGAALTFVGGTVRGTGVGYTVQVNGTFTMSGGVLDSTSSAALLVNNNVHVTVTGGTVGVSGIGLYVNDNSKATIALSGGTYSSINPGREGTYGNYTYHPVSSILAPGYALKGADGFIRGDATGNQKTVTVVECTHDGAATPNEDGATHGGDCPYCGTKFEAAPHTLGADNKCEGCNTELKVKVETSEGATIYLGESDFAKAFDNYYNYNNVTVTLLSDIQADSIEMGDTQASVHVLNTSTLDLAGHTITSSDTAIYVYPTGNLTIQDSSSSKTGQVVSISSAAILTQTGMVSLTGGTYTGIPTIDGKASSTNVSSLLANHGTQTTPHYAYFNAQGNPIALGENQRELTGPVTVAECKHEGVEATPNNNGTHSLKCPYCGYTEAAEPCTYGTEHQHNDTNHWKTCTVCQGTTTPEAHYLRVTADEPVNGVTKNYEKCDDCDYTRNPFTVTVTVPSGLTYGSTVGIKPSFTISTEKTYDTVQLVLEDGEGTKKWLTGDTLPNDISAGTYKLYLTGGLSDNPMPVFLGRAYFTVSPATLTGDMVTLSPESVTYSGTEQKPTITVKQGDNTLAEGTNYDVAYSSSNFTNAGTVKITVTGKGNYEGTVEKSYTIAQATPTISWINTTQELTYTGQPATITAPAVTLVDGETFSGTIKYSYAVGNSTSYTSGLPTDAGTYTIKASVDAEGNYAAADSTNTLTLTIKQAKVTITWGNDAQTTTYTGKPAEITAPTVSAENGLTVSVAPKYSYAVQGSDSFTPGLPTNAGTYTVRASIAASDNLTAASADMTLTISKVTLSISGAAVDLKTYDGSTTAIVSSVTFSDLVNGEELTKGTDYTATGEFGSENAGENKSVTVTVTLSAESSTAKNYTLTSGTFETTGKIEKADSTITAAPTATGIAYGQALSDSTLSGGESSVPGTFAWTNGSTKPSAGTAQYSVTFAPTDEVNYNTATANVSVTVAKATPTITWGGAAQTVDYTGNAAAITAPTVTLVNGESFGGTISYSYSTGDSTVYTSGLPTNAGTYTVKASIAEQDNYTAAESGEMTLTISKVNYTGATTANTSAKFGTTATYGLAALLPDESTAGTPTTSSDIFDGTPSVSGKTLTYKLKADAVVDSTGDITVPVTATNYNDFSLTITVTVKNKDVPTLTVSPITVTYTGEAVPSSAIRGTAKVGDTTVPGNWSFAVGQNLTNVADSGTKTVIFTPNDSQNYEIATASVSVTINKATPSLTLKASPATLPNGGTVTLTLSGLPTGGSATVSCDHETISVTNESGNTWTAELPAGGASYTFTASYAGDSNYNSAAANCTVRVEKITPTLRLTADPASLTGGGTVTLTLSGLPVGGTATVTCTGGITVTAGAGNTWTSTLPNSTATYTFTASYAGNDSYHAASASCTVATTEVVILPDPPADDDGTKFQLVMETEISEVPEGLKDVAGLETPEKLVTAMKTAITEANSGVPQANISVYDVELMVSTNGGSTWTPATKENFPSSGLVITLPYPDGTNSSYQFTVVHMFTSGDFGHNPGETEKPAITNTADGIRFTVTGLSPISVGWVQTSTPSVPSGPSISNPGGGGGGSVTTYAITVEKSEHGKVTSNRTNASNGSTVTLTATPDSGYVLNTLAVTDSRGYEIKLTAQGGGKYTFTMPSRAVIVTATFAPLPADVEQPCDGGAACPSHGFTDLGTVGTWHHEAVDYVLRNGLMNGYSSTMFGPNDNLSRAQLAQILYNKEGKPIVTSGSVFTDVADGQWYAPAITWAAANGIVGGYGDGRFGPDDNITREQLAVMLWRYAGSPAATDKELHFTDADQASGYALEALRWAAENGILNGYGDGRLNPGGLATRAQVAQMLKNFLEEQ